MWNMKRKAADQCYILVLLKKIILAWKRKLNSVDLCHMLEFIIGFCVPSKLDQIESGIIISEG